MSRHPSTWSLCRLLPPPPPLQTDIEHVSVVMAEAEDCAGRTGFYDAVGVIRDVMQVQKCLRACPVPCMCVHACSRTPFRLRGGTLELHHWALTCRRLHRTTCQRCSGTPCRALTAAVRRCHPPRLGLTCTARCTAAPTDALLCELVNRASTTRTLPTPRRTAATSRAPHGLPPLPVSASSTPQVLCQCGRTLECVCVLVRVKQCHRARAPCA